jgi:hypothetical protein
MTNFVQKVHHSQKWAKRAKWKKTDGRANCKIYLRAYRNKFVFYFQPFFVSEKSIFDIFSNRSNKNYDIYATIWIDSF